MDQKGNVTPRKWWSVERETLNHWCGKNALPQLNTLRLIKTTILRAYQKAGQRPFAHTADNDLSVGMFIDYLSKSTVWKESVVFILEDDAQDGPDHVDAHRSPAYIAGPFVKRNFVDHTPYATTGILRTMELILGLPSHEPVMMQPPPLFGVALHQSLMKVYSTTYRHKQILPQKYCY